MKSRFLFGLLVLGGLISISADGLRADSCHVTCNTERRTKVEKENQKWLCCECKWLQATAECSSSSDKECAQN